MAKRSGRKKRSGTQPLEQRPWRRFRNPYKPIEILTPEQLTLIHDNSMRILSDIGIKVLDSRSRSYLSKAGAHVDEAAEMVRFDPDMVMDLIKLAPESLDLYARNSEYNLSLGGNEIIFSSVMCPPFANDLDRGRRAGTFDEMCEYVKLVHSINAVHQAGGGGFEPLDLPADTRHLDVAYAHATLTDKTWKFWSNGKTRARDAIEIAKILMEYNEEDLVQRPAISAPINTNSPLMIDTAMAEGIVEMARVGQPLIIAPFTMAGAMSPATEAGALSVQNAEALAHLTRALSRYGDSGICIPGMDPARPCTVSTAPCTRFRMSIRPASE